MEELEIDYTKSEDDLDNALIKEEKLDVNQDGFNTEETIIKEFFIKETGITLKEMAVLFGQSEEEISKEFGAYKAQKLFQKMDYVIDDASLSNEDFKNKLISASKFGFKSVSVLPSYVGLAKSALKGKKIIVRALISYPFGEDLSKVKYCAVKCSSKMGADAFLVCVSSNNVKRGNYKLIAKEFKKIVKLASKKNVTVMFDDKKLTPLEIEKCSRYIIKDAKVYSIMPSSVFESKVIDTGLVKDIADSLDGKCYVDGAGNVSKAIETIGLLSAGANVVSSKNCEQIAVEINSRINSQILD